MRLTAAISREDGWFVARCLEVDVASQGKTLEAAQVNLQEALGLLYEDRVFPSDVHLAIISTIEISP